MLPYALITGLIQLALHLVQIPDLAIGNPSHHNRAPSMLHDWCDTGLLPTFRCTQRLTYLTEIFRTLIRQSKGLYSIALLSSLYAPWPTGAFWHCFWFLNSGVLPYKLASQSLLFTMDVEIISSVVQWCQPSVKQDVTLMKLSSAYVKQVASKVKVKLATLVEGDPKAPFSIATTPRFWGGRYSFPWIAPLYPWCVPYNAEC